MTLDRRMLAIIAGHLQAALDIVAPPGEGPSPPPDPEPGPGTAPTVKTLAATGVTTTAATLNGELLSLGNVDSETPRTTVDVGFQWRVVGAGTWTETTPVEQVAVGAFSVEITGLTPDTAYEFRAAVTSEAGNVFGNLLTFTSDEVTDPEQPGDNFLDLTAGATYALTAINGTVAGIAGAWEVAGADPLRQGGVTSLVVGDLVPSLGVRNERYVIENADLALANTATLLILLQRRALSPRPWMTIFARDDGFDQIGGISIGLKHDGGARLNYRHATSGAPTIIDLAAGTVDDGDIIPVWASIGPGGMFFEVAGVSALNANITSISTGIVSRTILGSNPTGGSSWDVALAGFWVWNGVEKSAFERAAIEDLVKARIRWAPPLTFAGEVVERALVDPRARAFVGAVEPTVTITAQPGNGIADVEDGYVLDITIDEAGTSTTGRYTMGDAGGTSAPAVITTIGTAPPVLPPEDEMTVVARADSGALLVNEDGPIIATWNSQPPAGSWVVVDVWERTAAAAPTIPGYVMRVSNKKNETLWAFRQSIFTLDRVATGDASDNISATFGTPTTVHIRAVAYAPAAGRAWGDIVASAQAQSEDMAGLTLIPSAGPVGIHAAWGARPTALLAGKGFIPALENTAAFAAVDAGTAQRIEGATGNALGSGEQVQINAKKDG